MVCAKVSEFVGQLPSEGRHLIVVDGTRGNDQYPFTVTTTDGNCRNFRLA